MSVSLHINGKQPAAKAIVAKIAHRAWNFDGEELGILVGIISESGLHATSCEHGYKNLITITFNKWTNMWTTKNFTCRMSDNVSVCHPCYHDYHARLHPCICPGSDQELQQNDAGLWYPPRLETHCLTKSSCTTRYYRYWWCSLLISYLSCIMYIYISYYNYQFRVSLPIPFAIFVHMLSPASHSDFSLIHKLHRLVAQGSNKSM